MLGAVPVSASKSPLPSRSHSYLTIEPSGSWDGEASSDTGLPSRTARPVQTKSVPTFEQRLSYEATGASLAGPDAGGGGGGGGGGCSPPPTRIVRSAVLSVTPLVDGCVAFSRTV